MEKIEKAKNAQLAREIEIALPRELTREQGILSCKAQAGKSGYSQSLYNLKDAAKMLNFLQTNNIMDMMGLDEKFKSMIGEQLDIQGKLKPVERRLGTLKKHLEQADIYFKSNKDMENGVCKTDRREESTQSAVSCIEKGSERSRENQKERLQYLAAGTAGTTTPQKAGYGAITERAAG